MSTFIQAREGEGPSYSTKGISRRDLLGTVIKFAGLLPLAAACTRLQTPPSPTAERDLKAEIAPYLQIHKSHIEPLATLYISKALQQAQQDE